MSTTSNEIYREVVKVMTLVSLDLPALYYHYFQRAVTSGAHSFRVAKMWADPSNTPLKQSDILP